MDVRCARDASSGTTPPNTRCTSCERMTSESSCDRITAYPRAPPRTSRRTTSRYRELPPCAARRFRGDLLHRDDHFGPNAVISVESRATRARVAFCTSTRTSVGCTRTPAASALHVERDEKVAAVANGHGLIHRAHRRSAPLTTRRGPVMVTLSGTTRVRRVDVDSPADCRRTT